MIEESTTIARDTTTISRVAAKDSTSLNAKIDSIIIEEYAADRSEQTTDGHLQYLHDNKKRNDTSKGAISPKKIIKVYGVKLSGTWSTTRDSLNKKMTHQATTKSEIKQKTPIQKTAGSKIVYVIVGISLLLFVGYVVWQNAVQ